MYTDNYEQEINLKDLLFSVLYHMYTQQEK